VAQEEAAAVSENDPLAWLEFAERDRRAARNALNAADYWDAAFHCQQAIEKLLKAAIVHQTGGRPPYIHDLRTLLRDVRGVVVPEEIARLVSDVDVYYVGTRYPGIVETEVYCEENISPLVERMEEVFQWFLANLDLENI
jgi:HEPN domain-containing protein